MINRKTALIIIFGVFILSILIRLPNLNRPLSDHHEMVTALVLICMESWKESGGADEFNYVPIMNYQNEGDKIYYAKNSDSKGNIMYITFGPGWYILAYVISQIFHITPSPLYLQILNISFDLISCFIFFEIICLLYKNTYAGNYAPHVIASIVFILSPLLLWVTGNAYVPGSAALPFILLTILYFVRMADDVRKITFKNISLSFIALFLSIYCDWVGVFIGCAFGFVFLFLAKKKKIYLLPSLMYFFAILVSMSVMFIQFASHAGIQKCIDILFNRFVYRSYNDDHGVFYLVGWFMDIFFTRNFPVLLLIAGSLFFLKQKKMKIKLSVPVMKAAIIAIVVFLIHNTIFLGWTAANDFSVMNYIIPFSILSGAMVYEAFSVRQLSIVLTIFFLVSIAEYYYFNRPGSYDRKNHAYAQYKQLGEQIKKIAKPDELIYINTEPAPQGWYYAKRNYYTSDSVSEAMIYFKQMKQNKCVIIHQQDCKIIWYKRIIKE